MGTRADFYVGRGPEAEWLGSIAFDGYPSGIDDELLNAKDEAAYRKSVAAQFADCDHATLPEQGWPWPWEDSQTTDFAYAFDGDRVFASCFGHAWFDPTKSDEDDDAERDDSGPKVPFPNMKERQNVTMGKRSGLLIIGMPRRPA